MQTLIARLKEPSSWAGLGVLAGAFGLNVAPDAWHTIVQFGTAAAGLAALLLKEKAS